MNVKVFLGLVCFILMCYAALPVSAYELSDSKNIVTVTPWHNYNEAGRIEPVYGSITSGQTNTYYCNVPSNSNTLNIKLEWSGASNDLSLTLLTPSNNIYGPFYDNYDGLMNKIIPLRVSGNPLMNGNWRISVSGVNVADLEYYSLVTDVQ